MTLQQWCLVVLAAWVILPCLIVGALWVVREAGWVTFREDL